MSDATPAPDKSLRAFHHLLVAVEDGKLSSDLSEEIRELVAKLHEAAIGANGKAKGSVSLSLDFKLEGGVVEVTGDYKVKAPRLARGRSIFWATPENFLTRSNPRQHELPLRDVSVPPARHLA